MSEGVTTRIRIRLVYLYLVLQQRLFLALARLAERRRAAREIAVLRQDHRVHDVVAEQATPRKNPRFQ